MTQDCLDDLGINKAKIKDPIDGQKKSGYGDQAAEWIA